MGSIESIGSRVEDCSLAQTKSTSLPKLAADSKVSVPSNEVGSGNSRDVAHLDADRLSSLARALFGTPHVVAWLCEDRLTGHLEHDSDVISTCLWSSSPQRITIGTLHLAFATMQSPIVSDPDQQRINALADIAAGLVEARHDLRRAKEMIAEKDLLAREADHRVANGLQLLHSALVLQAKLEDHTAARAAMQTAARRISAVARAHRHLHRAPAGSPRDGTPDAATYLRALLNDISQHDEDNHPTQSRSVALQVDPGAAEALPISLLPRVGLIAAELVANALKHGAGPITVTLRHATSAGNVALAVSDDGPGFPADFVLKARNGKGLGMRLVAALSGPDSVWIDPTNRRCVVVHLGC